MPKGMASARFSAAILSGDKVPMKEVKKIKEKRKEKKRKKNGLVQHFFKGHDGVSPSSSNNALASCRSAVSNPSVNRS